MSLYWFSKVLKIILRTFSIMFNLSIRNWKNAGLNMINIVVKVIDVHNITVTYLKMHLWSNE